jgi:hypothetical protein
MAQRAVTTFSLDRHNNTEAVEDRIVENLEAVEEGEVAINNFADENIAAIKSREIFHEAKEQSN